ncbi:hypothetical protein [Paenibacillus chibensis]|uniref:hypothetical protein n=1 Tax=Paenibacillus chibensis TaxID=59846 RepID=UPI000FDCA7B5|nr:hypothetical protein [Paenibacillus chibensis]MEC0368739.1 hypothetical protein [Paenibacillus chibensis]
MAFAQPLFAIGINDSKIPAVGVLPAVFLLPERQAQRKRQSGKPEKLSNSIPSFAEGLTALYRSFYLYLT